MKQTKFENNIIEWLKKHLDIIFIITITIISLIFRFLNKDFASDDYNEFLKIWMDYISSHGHFLALKDTFANYNQPYLFILVLLSYIPLNSLYSIKIFSTICDFFMAFSAVLLIGELTNQNKILKTFTYTIIIMLPTVILNSSLWAQCDSLYTSFVILSLYFLIKNKYHLSFIMLGVSFTFKLQFIFIIPLYLILYFKEKKFSLTNFLYIPLANLVLCLPSLILGHPLNDIIKTYFKQISRYPHTTMNMFNFYTFLPDQYKYVSLIGYSLIILIFGLILYLLLKTKKELSNKDKITLGLLIIVICVYFLPSMHERYLYMADILSIIWYLSNNNLKHNWFIPLGIITISLSCYLVVIFEYESQILSFTSLLFPIVIYQLIKEFINSLIVKKEGLN